MIIKKFINSDISGLYDIGKRYSLDLYANNDSDLEELTKALPKNMKNIEVEKMDKHIGYRLLSYNISELFKYQKSRGLNFKLEHL